MPPRAMPMVPLLTDHRAPRADIHAVYQQRRHVPQRIVAFVRYLAGALAERFTDV